MSADEIIKHIPEIASATKVVAAAVPFTAIVKRMLGPAADELAEMWRDQVRLYRYERQLKCVEKAENMAKDAGFTPQAVPPKILFPLLEGASFEEDENLHTMWAALLANAASPQAFRHVRPGFLSVLKQMAPDEATTLKWIYDSSLHDGKIILLEHCFSIDELEVVYKGFYVDADPLWVCLEGLEAAKLITLEDSGYSMSSRGCSFIEGCTAPTPKPKP